MAKKKPDSKQRMTLGQAWSWLILVALVLGFSFDMPGLLALGAMLAIVLLGAWLWNRFALRNFVYRRKLDYSRAFPGEEVGVELQVANEKLLPLSWLQITDFWPMAIGPSDERLIMPSHREEEGEISLVMVLPSFARIKRRMRLLFRKRGVYRLGPAAAESGDPFGIFRTRRSFPDRERVVVFPQIQPLQQLQLHSNDPFGARSSKRQLFEDLSQPIGIRGYQSGDSFRRIHWPATARTGELQSRVYQPITGLDLVICLNVLTMEHQWMGIRPRLFEELVSVAASLATLTYEQGYRVGLISNGMLANSGQRLMVRPGRHPRHHATLLESLAGITPIITAPFERFLLDQAPHLEYGSSMLVVTALTPAGLAEALVRLKERTRRTTLISLAEQAPEPVYGVEIVHWPNGPDGKGR